jgi:hypothetical protein
VLAGGNTVLVTGPTGVGKSTELARAKKELDAERVTCLVQIDRLTNIHKLTADALLRLLTQELIKIATARKLQLSSTLSKNTTCVQPPPGDTLRSTTSEVRRRASQRVTILIDGLERLAVGAAPEIFDELSQLPEAVDLVVVIPWHAAFGGNAQPVLRAGERLHRVFALETEGTVGQEGAEFLSRVLARRLFSADSALPEPLAPLFGEVFQQSGGLPRTFLQLMADAGAYARVKRAEAFPDRSDLLDAVHDQQDSFRRALLPGDAAAIRSVIGTDGRELDLDRRIRLLAQGMLLERMRDGRAVLKAHPLIIPILSEQPT